MPDSALNESLLAAIREINYIYDRENLPEENRIDDPE
jgi:hypothetical protein